MRKLSILSLIAMVAISCQSDFVDVPQVNLPNKEVEAQKFVRSYEDALKIAEEAVLMIDEIDTRSSQPRRIMRDNGQVVCKPVTRSGETSEEPIMYIFNNEDNAGFTIVAADASHPSLIAVTESGNYTYGEPTGAEPFDLLMEDVANTLAVVWPIDPFGVKEEIENELHKDFGPLKPIQWGVGNIYGSLYPDGVAYDEAAAIAQTIMCNQIANYSYEVTNPNSPKYGQIIAVDKTLLGRHLRYDHPNFSIPGCTNDIHNQIAELYLEIGYRLSSNTSISLSNKIAAFSIDKVRSVANDMGMNVGSVTSFTGSAISPRYYALFKQYYKDTFVFRGTVDNTISLPNGSAAHCWISTGFDDYSYDKVKYKLNKLIDASHPDPNGYTEISRERVHDYMLYLNWGFDGISNGWFHSGCFDMSAAVERDDIVSVIDTPSTYSYNFANISFFSQLAPPIGQ